MPVLGLRPEEATGDAARLAAHATERRDLPHAERNLFHVDDFRVMLGEAVELRSEYRGVPPDDSIREDEARQWIRSATDVHDWSEEGLGVVALALKGDTRPVEPRVDDERLLLAATSRVRDESPLEASVATALEAGDSRVVCPLCRGALAASGETLDCTACDGSFGVHGGVPALYDERAPDITADDLERRVAARWNDPERVGAALELHERLLLPDATRVLEWDFARAVDRDAWTVGNSGIFAPLANKTPIRFYRAQRSFKFFGSSRKKIITSVVGHAQDFDGLFPWRGICGFQLHSGG